MSDARGRRLATIPVAAEYCGISRVTFRGLIADGVIPAYRIGQRALRVDLNEVDASLRPIEVDDPSRPSEASEGGH